MTPEITHQPLSSWAKGKARKVLHGVQLLTQYTSYLREKGRSLVPGGSILTQESYFQHLKLTARTFPLQKLNCSHLIHDKAGNNPMRFGVGRRYHSLGELCLHLLWQLMSSLCAKLTINIKQKQWLIHTKYINWRWKMLCLQICCRSCCFEPCFLFFLPSCLYRQENQTRGGEVACLALPSRSGSMKVHFHGWWQGLMNGKEGTVWLCAK